MVVGGCGMEEEGRSGGWGKIGGVGERGGGVVEVRRGGEGWEKGRCRRMGGWGGWDITTKDKVFGLTLGCTRQQLL